MRFTASTKLLIQIVYLLQSVVTSANDLSRPSIEEQNFYSSIGISDLDGPLIQREIAELRRKNGSSVELACRTAQLSLSETQVDTYPLNSTVVDENW
jgi:hypothetical protein